MSERERERKGSVGAEIVKRRVLVLDGALRSAWWARFLRTERSRE